MKTIVYSLFATVMIALPLQLTAQSWGLDRDFNGSGYVHYDFPPYGQEYSSDMPGDIAVQSDGKIIITGYAQQGLYGYTVVCNNPFHAKRIH